MLNISFWSTRCHLSAQTACISVKIRDNYRLYTNQETSLFRKKNPNIFSIMGSSCGTDSEKLHIPPCLMPVLSAENLTYGINIPAFCKRAWEETGSKREYPPARLFPGNQLGSFRREKDGASFQTESGKDGSSFNSTRLRSSKLCVSAGCLTWSSQLLLCGGCKPRSGTPTPEKP